MSQPHFVDRKLHSRLNIVFNNERPKRYLPKSLDGGTGWGVWDDQQCRFLSDTEVRALPKEAFTSERPLL